MMAILVFFLLGVVASYLFFPKCSLVERVVYSIIFSVCFTTMAGYFLFLLGIKNQPVLLMFISLALLFSGLVLLRREKNNPGLYKTFYDKDFLFVLLFSLIGTIFRYWFLKIIVNFQSPYSYSAIFKNGPLPDLGFYTGMARDHANYFGANILKSFFDYFSANLGVLEIFLGVFLYLGLAYLLFVNFKKNKVLAYLGVALLCLGPIEIFYTTLSFYGHPLSYAALFSLFLFFKSKDQKTFWPALLLAVYGAITYYTATIVIILSSFGFLIVLFIKDRKNIFKNKKAIGFLAIFLITLAYLFFMSNMKNFTTASAADSGGVSLSFESISLAQPKAISPENLSAFYSSTLYKDPRIFGLSAIGWQSLFFLLCGASFILYLISKKDFSEENLDLLLCIVPAAIVSAGFFYLNYPARIFDYFAFFGLMTLTIPKNYYKIFAVASLIFITATSICVAKDKTIFFENSDGELNAAKEISAVIKERIFSDEKFVNNLILGGYYGVTGTDDNNPLLIGLFYSNDKNLFLDSIKILEEQGIKYIATTKRMREKYILMLNYPKKNLINSELYEKNLQKVYDNGDVKIYSTNENSRIP